MEQYFEEEHQTNPNLNQKTHIKDKARYQRKQAMKEFKSMKKQLEEEYLMTLDDQTGIPRSAHTKLAIESLKATTSSVLINKTVKKEKLDKMPCAESLKTAKNLEIFEFKIDLRDDDNNLLSKSSRELKFIDEYNNVIKQALPWGCKRCGIEFFNHIPLPPGYFSYGFKKSWGYCKTWESKRAIAHWLKHKDTALAEIFSKEGIKGIIGLGQEKTASFFRDLYRLYDKK